MLQSNDIILQQHLMFQNKVHEHYLKKGVFGIYLHLQQFISYIVSTKFNGQE